MARAPLRLCARGSSAGTLASSSAGTWCYVRAEGLVAPRGAVRHRLSVVLAKVARPAGTPMADPPRPACTVQYRLARPGRPAMARCLTYANEPCAPGPGGLGQAWARYRPPREAAVAGRAGCRTVRIGPSPITSRRARLVPCRECPPQPRRAVSGDGGRTRRTLDTSPSAASAAAVASAAGLPATLLAALRNAGPTDPDTPHVRSRHSHLGRRLLCPQCEADCRHRVREGRLQPRGLGLLYRAGRPACLGTAHPEEEGRLGDGGAESSRGCSPPPPSQARPGPRPGDPGARRPGQVCANGGRARKTIQIRFSAPPSRCSPPPAQSGAGQAGLLLIRQEVFRSFLSVQSITAPAALVLFYSISPGRSAFSGRTPCVGWFRFCY